MFYSQFILAKKGPLGTIWIAAHLERKLRKNQVADTDIGTSVDSIIFPEVPIALRLSSHLLLGVVKIYSKKVNYLFDDCSEALLKIKQAFRSAAVDLPPEESTAPYHSITLPETFDLDDFELPDNELFQSNYVDHHVSTREQITLQDTLVGVAYATSQYGLDDRFGDGDVSQIGLDIDEDLFGDKILPFGVDGVATDLEAEAQATVQPMTPLKNDEINVGTTEVSDAMTDDCNRFQMQCAPMIMDLNEVADTPFTVELMNDGSVNDINGIFGCDDVPNFENSSSPESPFPTNNENSFCSTDFQDDICDTNPPQIVGALIEENNKPLFKMVNNPHGDFNASADSNMPFLCQREITTVDDIMRKSSLCCSGQVKDTAPQSENINSDGCFHGVQVDMNNDLALNKSRGQYIPADNGIAGASSITQEASVKQYSIFEAISGKSGSESNSCPFSEGILSKDHVSSTPIASNFRPTVAHLGEHYSAMNNLVSTDVGVAATHGFVELDNNYTQNSREPGSSLDVKSCPYVSKSNSMDMNEIGSASLPFPRVSTVSDTAIIDEVPASFLCHPDGPLQKIQPPFVTEISSMTDTAKGLDKPCEFVSSLTSDSVCARTPNHIGFLSGNSIRDCPRLGYDNKMEHLGIVNHEPNQPFVNLSTCGEVCPSKDVSKGTFPYYESCGDVEVLKNGTGVCMEAMANDISNPFTYGRVSNNHVHILQPCSSQQGTSFCELKNPLNMSGVMPATVAQYTHVEYGEGSAARFSEKNSSCVSVASHDCDVVKKHIDNEILRESYAENTDKCTEFDSSEKLLSVPGGIKNFPFVVGDATNGANLEGDTNVYVSTNAPLNSEKIQDTTEGFQTPQTPVFTAVSRSIIMDRENMLDFSAPALTISDTGYLTANSNDLDNAIIISGRKHDPIKSTSKRARYSDVFFGSHNSSRTVKIMDDDDDLLSSILVGKGSLSGLKLKPSPPSEVTPCKRIRLTPRASSSKRKVIVDDTIILHGDAMRHQLTSTADIRRPRKKAPYTRSDILLTRRQFMEDMIFDEPTCTGVLSELHNLNNSNIINVAVIDASTPPLESMVINSDIGADNFTRSTKKSDENNNPMQTCLFDRNDVKNSSTKSAELIDSCMLSYNSLCGDKDLESDQRNPFKHTFESLYCSGKSDDILRAIKVSRNDGNNQILQSVEITNSHMKSDTCPSGMKASVSDESKLRNRSLESMFVCPSEDDVNYTRRRLDEDDACVDVQPMLMVQHTQFQCGDVNTGGTKVSTEAHVSSPRREDKDAQVSPKYRQHGIEIDGGIRNIELTSALIDGKNLSESDTVHPSTSFEKADGYSLAPTVISSVQPCSDDSVRDLNGNEDHLGGFKCTEEPSLDPPREQNDCVSAPVCEDLDNAGICVTDMAYKTQQLDDINSLSGGGEEGICRDKNSSFISNVNDINHSISHVIEVETQRESGSIENGENSNCQAAATNNVNLASTTMSPTVAESADGMENLIFEQDTDFLKLDYECCIEGSEAIPSSEEVVSFENSGWSSRTRAVAKYLQTWFCNEVGQGTMSLPLDGILSGKTRKEASRMFFETLVLKSRDYVEVEQEKAYGRIGIKAGGKLMKDDNRV